MFFRFCRQHWEYIFTTISSSNSLTLLVLVVLLCSTDSLLCLIFLWKERYYWKSQAKPSLKEAFQIKRTYKITNARTNWPAHEQHCYCFASLTTQLNEQLPTCSVRIGRKTPNPCILDPPRHSRASFSTALC